MKGYPHLLFVLVLTHVAMSLLAAIGEVLFVGTALYLVVPVVRGGVLLWAAAAAGRGFVAPDEPPSVPARPLRRWPLVLLIVTAQVGVAGYVISNLIGVLPWVSDTINLVSLLTNVALPTAITWLAGRMLGTWQRPPRRVPGPPRLLYPVGALPAGYDPGRAALPAVYAPAAGEFRSALPPDFQPIAAPRVQASPEYEPAAPPERPALPPTLVDPLAGPARTPVTKLLPVERAR